MSGRMAPAEAEQFLKQSNNLSPNVLAELDLTVLAGEVVRYAGHDTTINELGIGMERI